ncbi:mechanosensitive ion channel [Nocardioides carbamazepini]|uniref:mechanosensitive ion channel family protein n=1 Tax=Nocardioides carbamazepini TaxID=2854259 RepID=UPI002149ABFB|nr:mechanosensitive ion channel family protein [Nocardioides carbamazepini]MCR1783964.1 mechanosensitive ion channel [Nocardioides carbamazepini]
MDVLGESWFWWAVGLIVGLPVGLVVLSEVHLSLVRRGNALARPVNRLRVWLIPTGALLVVLTQAATLDDEDVGVRVVATLVGFIAVSVALGMLNAALFGNASDGTWRERLPSIFVDLGRLVLVVAGAALVASLVWGLDIGGLFAALGVGSIVIGLALQNAVGSVVSGLLLLFEQPFRIGDTLDVDGIQGRVVEVNWRSTHVDTGVGIQVIPNATIAGASFANLSRPTPAHDLVVECAFDPADDPAAVVSVLLEVARRLPLLQPGGAPDAQPSGGGGYIVRLPLLTVADSGAARSRFFLWLWYAAQRAGLSLDGHAPRSAPTAEVEDAVRRSTRALALSDEDVDLLVAASRIATYGPDETVLAAGTIPEVLSFVARGRVDLLARGPESATRVGGLEPGEPFGESVLSRTPTPLELRADGVCDVLEIDRAAVDRLVLANADAARRLQAVVDIRNRQARPPRAPDSVPRPAGVQRG